MQEEQTQFLQSLEALSNENNQLRSQTAQMSMFSRDYNNNLVQYQLDLTEELERIEHILRGHILKKNAQTKQEEWIDPPDDSFKPLNEYGVQLLMKIILFYLNRNLILSDYSKDMINYKMLNFSRELCKVMYLSHIEMGIVSDNQKRMFPMITREIVDLVHSAYLRAKDGAERTSLRKMMNISESVNNMGIRQMPMQKKRSMLNPMGWFGS